MKWIRDFLIEIDEQWKPREVEPITLRVLGSLALFLQTGYARGTKDGDLIQTDQLTPEVSKKLMLLAGQGTMLHKKHRIYLDIVGRNVPMLSPSAVWNPYPIPLTSFRVEVLDVVDVVVSKLKRFHGDDQSDIRAMVERRHIDHVDMLNRFGEVIQRYRFDGRADRLPAMAERFNDVERDWFLVEETPFCFDEEEFRM